MKKYEKLITRDGNIKKNISSSIIYEFRVGDVAKINYPSGGGNGPRVFKGYCPCIESSGIGSMVVKVNA